MNADDTSLVETTKFDSLSFLESHSLSTPPDYAFAHVESSVDIGVKEGNVVEMPLEGGRFWLATVLSVHGPLLRLALAGGGEKELWHDLSKKRLYPLGWCQMNKVELEPPDSLKTERPDWRELALSYLEDVNYETISMHHIDGDGVTPVERIRIGMRLEVQSETHPHRFWPAEVTENRGGILTLKFCPGPCPDSDEKEKEPDLQPVWKTFYTSHRLFPYKHAWHKGHDYVPPGEMEAVKAEYFFGSAGDEEEQNVKAVPADLLDRGKLPNHSAAVGEYAEVLLPESDRVELGVVTKVWSQSYYEVSLVDDDKKKFVAHSRSENIFPLRFWEFMDESLGKQLKARKSRLSERVKSIPKMYWGNKNRLDTAAKEFKEGQKLEVLFHGRIHSAAIKHVVSGVFKLELDSDNVGDKTRLFLSTKSDSIFPFGWANSNSIPCMLPKSFLVHENVEEEKRAEPTKVEKVSKPEDDTVSSWCPPIYFNYQCYSASFLSKARLASLPRSVGPGSVCLVMHKVLELIVGSSYKSRSVLKRLEYKSESRRADFVVEQIKGKSRVQNLKGDVEIPTRSYQVDAFCREVCQKVGACPYLVSTQVYSKDECPANCQSKPKTDFHAEEQSGIIFRRGGRRSKKRRHHHLQQAAKDKSDNKDNNNGSSSGDESYESELPSTTNHSRSSSPDNEQPPPKRKVARKEWENILPKSEIRTRGAKLPNWKLHMKIRPTKKELCVIANTNLRKGIVDNGDQRLPSVLKRGPGGAIRLVPAFKPSEVFPEFGRHRRDSGPPPPIRRLRLHKNPERWSSKDTATFLIESGDCAHLAQFMEQDDIDGTSFMLIDFDTAKQFWSLTVASAIRLCRHVESVKLAYFNQYMDRTGISSQANSS